MVPEEGAITPNRREMMNELTRQAALEAFDKEWDRPNGYYSKLPPEDRPYHEHCYLRACEWMEQYATQ